MGNDIYLLKIFNLILGDDYLAILKSILWIWLLRIQPTFKVSNEMLPMLRMMSIEMKIKTMAMHIALAHTYNKEYCLYFYLIER